jgi:hypothetical protein
MAPMLSSLLLLCLCAPAAASGNVRTVVVLTAGNAAGSPGAVQFNRGLRDAFAADSSEHIVIHNEELSRFKDADGQVLAEFLRRKYAGQRIYLVVAGLASSLDFTLAYRQQMFPGVPVVVAAVDQQEMQKRKLPLAPIQCSSVRGRHRSLLPRPFREPLPSTPGAPRECVGDVGYQASKVLP